MSLLSLTVGRFVPRFRTLNEWVQFYIPIINSRQIKDKTLANRRAHIRRIVGALGSRRIGSIRPHEISALITAVHAVHPVAAKRTLVEARCMFDEALANGWVAGNPARAVRMPRVKVTRRRLALSEWQLISDHARHNQPPWVWRMVLLALVTGQRRSDLVKMRFGDVWAHDDGHEYLHIAQAKTGMRVAIPLALRLGSIGVSVGEAIQLCRDYAPLDADGGGYLLRKTTLRPPCPESMSWRFEQAREAVLPAETVPGQRPPTLHECRSLAAREYLRQGINTMILLGHSRQSMTDLYHDDRGLDARDGRWRTLEL